MKAGKPYPVEERVLVLTPTGRDAQLACQSLKDAGLIAESCRSMEELCRKIGEGAGGVLIADEALTFDAIKCLTSVLEKEPPWSDLSLIIFTAGGEERSWDNLTDAMLSRLGNVTFLERPIRIQTLVSAVQAALRGRRRQYQCRELLEEQKEAVERLDLLADVANLLLLSDRPHEMVGGVFRKISNHLGLEIYLNYLFDMETQLLRLNGHSGITEEIAERIRWLALGEAVCGVVAKQGKRIVAEEIQTSKDASLDLVRSLGIDAYACFPLLANGHLIGILSFGTRQRSKFNREELALMETVSNQVSAAIERKRTEEALQELNQALEGRVQERTNQLQESADQMEAFSYSISHDLRAPLRTIRGFSQALLEDYGSELDTVGIDYLNRLMDGAERMDVLIQDLLAYSRIGRSKLTFESIDLERCVDNVLVQFEEEVRIKEAKVTVQRPLAAVQGHPPTLEQAITNLVSNALKFTEPATKPRVVIWTDVKEETVRLWIQDNGIGIAPEHQYRVFGVFERLHGMETYPGTGIGLAIVAKAVTRMGGRAGVESALGQGSRFWIELPKATVASELDGAEN